MTKYEVELTQEEVYIFEIEAENEDKAVGQAIELFDENKSKYYYDSDTKINVVRSEE